VLTQLKGFGIGLAAADQAAYIADCNLALTAGMTYRCSGGTANKPPSGTGSNGFVRVGKGQPAFLVQEFYSNSGVTMATRTSTDSGATWGEWGELVTLKQIQTFGLGYNGATLTGDLNTPLVTSFVAVTGTASNNLLVTPATLIHQQWGTGGNDHGTQLYQTLNSNAALNNRLLWRTKLGGVWGTPKEAAALDQPAFTTSLQCAGPVKVGQYTLTTLPSASAFNGYEIDVTNATVAPAGPKRCRSNGSNWLILNTNTPVS
jgi:hypothetical protein